MLKQNISSQFSATALSIFLVVTPLYGMALPQGANVTEGTASISNPNESTTEIDQSSSRAVINWDSFNVKSDELVRFNQPDSQSVTLNRITGNMTTSILGQIEANGQIFLINPTGIIFGEGARINVGSLFATTLDISDQDFMNQQYNFIQQNQESGSIINRGLIQASSTGGYVGFMADTVSNEGTIIADYGSVHMGAGRALTMDFNGDQLIEFEVTKSVLENGEAVESAVSNTGTIRAKSGRIELKANVARDIFSDAVNNKGVLEANSVVEKNGEIYLGATGGNVTNTGTIKADGYRDGAGSVVMQSDSVTSVNKQGKVSARAYGKGIAGDIHIMGKYAGVFSDAELDATGVNGGGEILIGGDFQGKGNIQTAQATAVGNNVKIKADAVEKGDGGKVIVWSDNNTNFYGKISAKGGLESGKGGFAEVSGKKSLFYQGQTDLTAAHGQSGTLLLDPENVVIQGGNDTSTVTLNDVDAFSDATGTTLTLTEHTLENATSNVLIQAENGISLSGTFNDNNNGEGTGSIIRLAPDYNLTMETRNATGKGSTGINLNGVDVEFQTQGTGSITINAGVTGVDAGGDTSGDGLADIVTGKLTTLGSGSITLHAEGDITISDQISVGNGGSLTLTAGNVNYIANNIINDGAPITFHGRTVVVPGNFRLQTGAGAHDISFSHSLSSSTNSSDLRNLTLNAGRNILFNSTIGDATSRNNFNLIVESAASTTTTNTSDMIIKSLSMTSGNATFGAAIVLDTIDLKNTAGSTVTFENSLSPSSTLTTGTNNFNIALKSTGTSTFGGLATFSNTGNLTIGNNAKLKFDGGLVATAPSIITTGLSDIYGGDITLGNITIGNGAEGTLIFGLHGAVGNVTINGTVDSASTFNSGIAISAGTSDVIFNENVGNTDKLASISINSAKNVTFSKILKANIAQITNASGTISFAGNTTLGTIVTTAQNYNVAFTGGTSTITADTNFINKGNLTFGNNLTDTITFVGGLDTTASNTTIIAAQGTINTSNTPMDIGTLNFSNTVGGSATFNAGTSTLNINGNTVSPSATNLTFKAEAVNVISGTTISASNTDLTFTANEINFTTSGVIGGLGTLTLQPLAANIPIIVGNNVDTGAGTLDITATDLSKLGNGFSNIIIGPEAGTSSITLHTANRINLTPSLTLRESGPGGSVINNTDVILNNSNLVIDTKTVLRNGAAVFSSKDLTITADVLNFSTTPDTIIATGDILLQPASIGTSIGLAGGAGTFNLTTAELANIKNGAKSITIGRADGTHAIAINALTVNDPLKIQTSNGGSILVSGDLTGTGNASITLDGPTTLDANITTAGQDITISNSALLGTNVTLSTGTDAGNISVTGKIDSKASNTNNLTLNAGTGTVNLENDIGTATNGELGSITLTQSGGTTFGGAIKAQTVVLTDTEGTIAFKGNLTLTAGLTTNVQTYAISMTGASNSIAGDTNFNNLGVVTLGDGGDTFNFIGGLGASSILAHPSSINIGGTINTSNAQINLPNAILIGDSILASGTADINLTGTVDGAHNLTATGNNITVSGAIGGSSPIKTLAVTSTGTITLNRGATTTEDMTFTGPAVIGGHLSRQGSGSIVFTSTLGISDETAIISDTINFGGAVSTSNASALSLTSSTIDDFTDFVIGDNTPGQYKIQGAQLAGYNGVLTIGGIYGDAPNVQADTIEIKTNSLNVNNAIVLLSKNGINFTDTGAITSAAGTSVFIAKKGSIQSTSSAMTQITAANVDLGGLLGVATEGRINISTVGNVNVFTRSDYFPFVNLNKSFERSLQAYLGSLARKYISDISLDFIEVDKEVEHAHVELLEKLNFFNKNIFRSRMLIPVSDISTFLASSQQPIYFDKFTLPYQPHQAIAIRNSDFELTSEQSSKILQADEPILVGPYYYEVKKDGDMLVSPGLGSNAADKHKQEG